MSRIICTFEPSKSEVEKPVALIGEIGKDGKFYVLSAVDGDNAYRMRRMARALGVKVVSDAAWRATSDSLREARAWIKWVSELTKLDAWEVKEMKP